MSEPPADGGPESADPVALELRLFATFREAVGQKTLTRRYREPVTVRSVLADLEDAYPALAGTLLDGEGELQSSVTVVRNGRHVAHFDGIDTVLARGDTLGVMPPVSGGAGRWRRGRIGADRARRSHPNG